MKTTGNNSLDFARDIPFEHILTNPILDIAARVWEEDRYEAFRVCYRSMRKLDDLVDHRKESGLAISPAEARQFQRMMADWLEALREQKTDDPFLADLVATLEKFRIPIWPWERLYQSMVFDLTHNGYSSMLGFLRYTEGAAVAPASIFTHLCGLGHNSDSYSAPIYDIRQAARPLALFSYLVHIVRDFQKDHLHNLNYFADDLILSCGLTLETLRQIAESEIPTPGFRKLIGSYVRFAEYYRARARRTLDQIFPCLQPRYQLSLELIYQLYSQIFERIDPSNGLFTAQELNPSPTEVQARFDLTLSEFSPIET